MNRRNIFKSLIGIFLVPRTQAFTIPIPSRTVVAGTRKLKANWSVEAEQDLMHMNSIFPGEKSLTSSSDMV